MKKPNFHKILDINNFAYAYLDAGFNVQLFNSEFARYSELPDLKERHICEVIPESFGLDSVFYDIISGEKAYFSLKHISRTLENEKGIFDFFIFPSGTSEYPLLCMIKDSQAEVEQKIRDIQKQNELRLAASNPDPLKEFIRDSIIGDSKNIGRVRDIVSKICHYPNLTVLLQGESGTGKNLVARVLHEAAKKIDEPFIEINCAAIPESLLESELFGHVKGAFTSAHADKKGLLEEADGGSLFLDEVGEIPLNIQVKLLNFLESRKIRPIGSSREKTVDVRLITATNRDLKTLVDENKFRQDLFYRLNVVKIEMPPLRYMGRDIITIATTFLHLFNMKFNKKLAKFSEGAERILLSYQWPGNVRELRNVIERSIVFADGDTIQQDDLIFDTPVEIEETSSFLSELKLPEGGLSLNELERSILQQALNISKGNQTKAANLLQISRETLRYRIEKYNLK